MNYIKKVLVIFILIVTNINYALGVDGGILAEDGSKLKSGDVGFEDIPGIITYAINFLMSIAATISIIFIIIGAYKILFGSLSQDKTKGRDTIFMAIGGFIIASLAWFIIKLILSNFS